MRNILKTEVSHIIFTALNWMSNNLVLSICPNPVIHSNSAGSELAQKNTPVEASHAVAVC